MYIGENSYIELIVWLMNERNIWSSHLWSNLSNSNTSPKKKSGFNRIWTHNLHITVAMLYQLSYEAIYVGSWSITNCERNEVTSRYVYMTIHILNCRLMSEWKKWSSQLWSNLSNCNVSTERCFHPTAMVTTVIIHGGHKDQLFHCNILSSSFITSLLDWPSPVWWLSPYHNQKR